MESRLGEELTFDKEVEIGLTRVKHVMTQDSIEIPGGFYESAEHIIDAINSAYLPTLKLPPSKMLLRHNPYINLVALQLHHNVYLLINQHLSHMLGFGERTVYTSLTVADREVIIDPNKYFSEYCDIIEAEHAYYVKAPLLRVVPFVVTKRNEIILYYFNLLQYKRVIVNEVNTICLVLIGERGTYIPFQVGSGRVAATLIFRKCT